MAQVVFARGRLNGTDGLERPSVWETEPDWDFDWALAGILHWGRYHPDWPSLPVQTVVRPLNQTLQAAFLEVELLRPPCDRFPRG